MAMLEPHVSRPLLVSGGSVAIALLTIAMAVWKITALFEVAYLFLVLLLSVSYLMEGESQNFKVVAICAVLVLLWLSYDYVGYAGAPAKYSSDIGAQWALAERIKSTGYLSPVTGVGKSAQYIAFPGLEVIVVLLDLVSGIPAVTWLDYGGPLLGITTGLVLFVLYKRLFGQGENSARALMIALFSASMISAEAVAIHQTLALMFLFLILFVIILPRRAVVPKMIIFTIVNIAILEAHVLTPALLTVILIVLALLSFTRFFRGSIQLPRSYVLLYLVTTVGWYVYTIGTSFALQRLTAALQSLSFELSSSYLSGALSPTGTKPVWMVMVILVGSITYALIGCWGFFCALRSRGILEKRLAMLGLAGGAAALALLAIPVGGSIASPGIQLRGLIYGYTFGAPLFVLGFQALREFTLRSRSGIGRQCLCILLLILTLSPALYYALPAYAYNQKTLITSHDARLGFAATYAVTVFLVDNVPQRVVFTSSLIFAMGEGISETAFYPFYIVIPARYSNITELLDSHRGLTFALRLSIVTIPDEGFKVTALDYAHVLDVSNIVYSSGDPVILSVIPAPQS
jgi:hypothetical protein